MRLDELEFDGIPVEVPRTAEVMPYFRKTDAMLIQLALDSLLVEWEESGRQPWLNRTLGGTYELEPGDAILYTNVVCVKPGEQRLWTILGHHKANNRRPSPCVRRLGWEEADSYSVLLAGSARKPVLVRAYAGDYQPPLPWQASAKQAEGGMAASRKFWANHAYILPAQLTQHGASITAPGWFAACEQGVTS